MNRQRTRLFILIGLQALSLGVIAYATFPNAFHFHALDLLIYHESARALLRGTWPAVEGRMVYPPLALVPFSLPHLLAALAGHSLDLQGYARLWPIVNIGFSVAISLLLSQFSPSFAPPSRTRLFWYTVFAIGRTAEKRGQHSTARNVPLTPPPGPLPSPTRGEGRGSRGVLRWPSATAKPLTPLPPPWGRGRGWGAIPPLWGRGKWWGATNDHAILHCDLAILSGPILLWKYDLFPTFLTVGAALALWNM